MNRQEKKDSGSNRRDFLKRAAAGMLGTAALSTGLPEGAWGAESIRSCEVLPARAAIQQPLTLIKESPEHVCFSFHGKDWRAGAVREEIRPVFSYDERGGPEGRAGALVISASGREGLHGYWAKTFEVAGGRHYRFRALRKTEHVATPRRSAYVLVKWQDEEGNPVLVDERRLDYDRGLPGEDRKTLPRWERRARPEFPRDREIRTGGWTEVSGIFQAPRRASRAVVELHLRWAPGGTAWWADVSLAETAPPAPRTARLAAVSLARQPVPAQTREEACAVFAPYIQEAAQKKADLVCLPEKLTSMYTALSMTEAAESIPGPSSDYFGALARKHDLYIVAGLVERAGPLFYNAAVLIGPEGELVGTYRKVCLTEREAHSLGMTPGKEFPVFQTRFGEVGMMICWDLQYPEVAQHLRSGGAEVIAVPIAGGNPILAQARAIENQVYVVCSTHSNLEDWLQAGVFDRDGQMLASAKESGAAPVAEVELSEKKYWAAIGDLQGQIPRQRPPHCRKG